MSEVENQHELLTSQDQDLGERRKELGEFYVANQSKLIRWLLKSNLACSKEEAEDILHNVCVSILAKSDSIQHLPSYFHQSLFNKGLLLRKGVNRHRAKCEFYKAEKASSIPPDQEIIMQKERLKGKIETILRDINEGHRKILHMYYVQEKSYENIAEELKLNIGTVKSSLNRAKQALAKVLPPNFLEENL